MSDFLLYPSFNHPRHTRWKCVNQDVTYARVKSEILCRLRKGFHGYLLSWFINVFSNTFILMYLNTVLRYFAVFKCITWWNVNALTAWLKVCQFHVSWCSVHSTSIEPYPIYTIENDITQILYPLSSICNFYC